MLQHTRNLMALLQKPTSYFSDYYPLLGMMSYYTKLIILNKAVSFIDKILEALFIRYYS